LSLKVSSHITKDLPGQWDAFLISHPEGSVLQSWFMYKIFSDTRNFKPVLVYCKDNEVLSGILLGVIVREGYGLKGVFSSRLVVYGGPIVSVSYPEPYVVCELLLDELVKITGKKVIFTQFRASYDLSKFRKCFEKHNFSWYPRLNLLINTANYSDVFLGMTGSRRRQIKKSLHNGASIIEPYSIGQIQEFYFILKNLYKSKVKKPLPDYSFFESFYHNISNEKYGKIFLVQFENKIVGGILCPFMNDKSMFEWYVCGLDKDYLDKGIFPSVLATWAAIEYAARNNINKFDFMGLGKPEVKYGVRDFKLKFGGEVVNYGRLICINRPILYWISEIGFNVLSLLKKI